MTIKFSQIGNHVEYYNKKELHIENGGVSNYGKELVISYIYDWETVGVTRQSIVNRFLFEGFDWDLDKSKGRITKRINSILRKEVGIKFCEQRISEIGNIISRNTLRPETYLYDFDNRFTWSDGDFGDLGSCYWGCHSGAKKMLRKKKAFAIRLYQKDGDGYGRAFLLPYYSNLILFNGYRGEIDKDTEFFSNLFYQILKKEFKFDDIAKTKIELTNHGIYDGTLYINGSGSGYLFSTKKNICTSINLKIADEHLDTFRCPACAKSIADTDEKYTEEYVVDGENRCWCIDCAKDNLIKCFCCGQLTESSIQLEGERICYSCAEKTHERCYHCSGWVLKEEMISQHGSSYCTHCHANTFFWCDVCEAYHPKRERVYLPDVESGSTMCETCAKENHDMVSCYECGYIHSLTRTHRYMNGVHFCETCSNKRDLPLYNMITGEQIVVEQRESSVKVELKVGDEWRIVRNDNDSDFEW